MPVMPVLGTIAKLRKATVKFVICVRLPVSVSPLGRGVTWLPHWTDFIKISCLMIFVQSFLNIQVSLKSDKINRYMQTYSNL